MEEFQVWTDSFNLIHLPTHGAEFTWTNGRGGARHTERKLDRAICNQSWLDLCSVSSVSTHIKHRSDHSPLLLDVQLTTLSMASQFKFMKMWSLHPDCRNIVLDCWNTEDSLLADEVIPNLVTDEINSLMTILPSHAEIKAAVFALNKDSALSWILPGFNSNIIALLPKTPEASSIDQYRPIAMANFKFKIISKIIADKLASIMPSIISEEQKGFIHDRNIKDCLFTASKDANLLHNKSYGGSMLFYNQLSCQFLSMASHMAILIVLEVVLISSKALERSMFHLIHSMLMI
ncbi:RNA-directed DNA polymerase (Reverse transcriptase) [Trifolium medium]|uniref:RNA-directed DNA polymerase (Reverse transcriptase) n=1 Tax=Trifolium medium TaxID=97028 RepID=A0A392LYG0_9FABA|nr:RNA-directed DNA polymerase (Reverse transcriptase) [Trifolium medium]